MFLNKLLRSILLLALVFCLALVAAAFTLAPSPVTASSTTKNTDTNIAMLSNSASLLDFIGQVKNGIANQLVGIYIPGLMALPVIQQPADNPGFVSDQPGVLTQFRMPSRYGTTGILAHNNLSGGLFYQLKKGDIVVLVYGDGLSHFYQVDRVRQFQALSPESQFSNFLDLDHPKNRLSSTELFTQMYNGGEPLVFQTCLAAEGNPSWGRIFVSAKAYVVHQPVVVEPPLELIGRMIRAIAN